MKNYLLIFACFLLLNSYSQSSNTIYLLINKKDTLIKKQITTKSNEYEGYRVIKEKKVGKGSFQKICDRRQRKRNHAKRR
jgi:hypothetical protein